MAAPAGAAIHAPLTAREAIPDPAGSVSIALAQFYPRLGDLAANLAAHLTIISSAAASGAGLVVFPELSLTGYFLKDQVPGDGARPSTHPRSTRFAMRRARAASTSWPA